MCHFVLIRNNGNGQLAVVASSDDEAKIKREAESAVMEGVTEIRLYRLEQIVKGVRAAKWDAPPPRPRGE